MKKSAIFSGALLVLIGLFFLLKSFGVIHVSFWNIFKFMSVYWPIGLILAGIALMFKQTWLAWWLVILTIFLLIFSGLNVLIADNVATYGQQRTIEQTVPNDPSIKSLDVNLKYGLGELKISSGDDSALVKNVVSTSNAADPVIVKSKGGDSEKISIQNQPAIGGFGQKHKEEWNLFLPVSPSINLKMDYGAADAVVDLSNLKVGKLDIGTGASNTDVKFGHYATAATINTGASNVNLHFPKDVGVKLVIDGGAVAKDLHGFTNSGEDYFSDGYDGKIDKIDVKVSAGASTIKADFYE